MHNTLRHIDEIARTSLNRGRATRPELHPQPTSEDIDLKRARDKIEDQHRRELDELNARFRVMLEKVEGSSTEASPPDGDPRIP